MSIEVISDKNVKARKIYHCDASSALISSMVYPDDFEDDEVKIMEDAFNSKWKINKGDIYNCQVNKISGEIGVFRSRPEILPIYFKYDMNDM